MAKVRYDLPQPKSMITDSLSFGSSGTISSINSKYLSSIALISSFVNSDLKLFLSSLNPRKRNYSPSSFFKEFKNPFLLFINLTLYFSICISLISIQLIVSKKVHTVKHKLCSFNQKLDPPLLVILLQEFQHHLHHIEYLTSTLSIFF